MTDVGLKVPRRAAIAHLFAALGKKIRNRTMWFGVRAQRLRQRRALSRLDDRLLRDIGLSRSEAMQEINRPFWR